MRNKLKKIVGTLLTFALAFTMIGGDAKLVSAKTSAIVTWTNGEKAAEIGDSGHVGYIVLNKTIVDELIGGGADFGTKYLISQTGPTGNGMTAEYASLVTATTGLNSGEVYLLPLNPTGDASHAKSGDAGTIVNTAIIGVLLAVEKKTSPQWYFNYYENDGTAIDFGVEANGTLPLELGESTAEIKDFIIISGEKTWVGDRVKPDSITVKLLQNGVEIENKTVRAVDGEWTYDFGEHPVANSGTNYTYKIEEVKVDGFTTSYNGFNIINTSEAVIVPAVKGTIEFKKVDEEEVALEGAVFELFDATDTTFATLIATATSDANGMVKFLDVKLGSYKIKEKTAPEGYLKSDVILEAVVEDEEPVTPEGSPVVNTQIKADVVVTKIDEDENEKVLAGAEFTLYKDDVKVGESEITGLDGKATFKDVPYGTYTLKETKAPAGYVKSEAIEEVKIDSVNVVNVSFSNIMIQGTVQITKVDKEDNEKVLPGAKFKIVDKAGVTVFEGITNDKGMIETNLPYGEYTLSEVDAPVGYEETTETWPITIVEDGKVLQIEIENVKTEDEEVDPIPVEDKIGTLRIIKVDAEDNEIVLMGAGFKIVDKDGKTAYVGTTDKNGVLETKLPLGVYTLSEVTAPKDYEKTTETWTVSLKEKDEIVTLIIENVMIEVEEVDPLPLEDEVGTLRIKKVDKETDAVLAGVKFRITDKDGDVVFEGMTDEKGMIEEELLVGEYTITEVEALPGYVPSTKSEVVKIEADGAVVNLTIANKKMYGLVSIKKVDAETGKVLEGAKFKIIDKAGEVILEDYTDEDGMLEVWLPKGEYVISETEAPEDYVKTDETWSVKVTADEQLFKLEVENLMIDVEEVSPVTLPQTGGIPSESLYVLGAFAIFTGMLLSKKKQRG